MDGCITLMPDGTEIEWNVSVTKSRCGKEFVTLEDPDQRYAVCGEAEHLALYAYSILAAVAAEKLSEVISHGK